MAFITIDEARTLRCKYIKTCVDFEDLMEALCVDSAYNDTYIPVHNGLVQCRLGTPDSDFPEPEYSDTYISSLCDHVDCWRNLCQRNIISKELLVTSEIGDNDQYSLFAAILRDCSLEVIQFMFNQFSIQPCDINLFDDENNRNYYTVSYMMEDLEERSNNDITNYICSYFGIAIPIWSNVQ